MLFMYTMAMSGETASHDPLPPNWESDAETKYVKLPRFPEYTPIDSKDMTRESLKSLLAEHGIWNEKWEAIAQNLLAEIQEGERELVLYKSDERDENNENKIKLAMRTNIISAGVIHNHEGTEYRLKEVWHSKVTVTTKQKMTEDELSSFSSDKAAVKSIQDQVVPHMDSGKTRYYTRDEKHRDKDRALSEKIKIGKLESLDVAIARAMSEELKIETPSQYETHFDGRSLEARVSKSFPGLLSFDEVNMYNVELFGTLEEPFPLREGKDENETIETENDDGTVTYVSKMVRFMWDPDPEKVSSEKEFKREIPEPII